MIGTAPTWEVAEIGRLLHTHQLDPGLAAGSLGLTLPEAERLKAGQVCPAAAGADADRSALLLNILVRLELRCGHDSVALRTALERPSDALSGDSIADRLRHGTDLAGLRRLREAAGNLPVVKVKMWRTPDRYS